MTISRPDTQPTSLSQLAAASRREPPGTGLVELVAFVVSDRSVRSPFEILRFENKKFSGGKNFSPMPV